MENILGYVSNFIFFIAIIIYIYSMIEDKTVHTQEENMWIYIFLLILIFCPFVSFYLIKKSNLRIKKLNNLRFIGKDLKNKNLKIEKSFIR